ncbi:hypothetical protein BJ741DRAFT_594705 [Chytriomyces cf. hyalinus JEL632]|nr:hypothetical protein BJ741DRAFT_594705 [Chytriomyces cf. hyalinus JEL632]
MLRRLRSLQIRNSRLIHNKMPSNELQRLGYKIEAERLVKLDGSPYEFTVKKNDGLFNQRHYEQVGDAMTRLIVDRLQTEKGLVPVSVPVDARQGEETSRVYASPDAFTSSKPLLMLVPGISIQVGQWARKIVINRSVYQGSMLQYVDRAQSLGFNVIILNSNLNKMGGVPIRGSESPEDHVHYVWKNLIEPSATRHVLAVAHSFGGVCMQSLLMREKGKIEDRILGIALTDSVHGGFFRNPSGVKSNVLAHHAVNWVRSDAPLGEGDGLDFAGVELRSAGTDQHDETTVVAIDEVFKYLQEQYEAKTKRAE